MKYSVSVEINKPIEEVVALFDNQDNYKHWMEGLLSVTLIEGNPGRIATKTEFRFKMGKREMTMTETVLESDLPGRYKVQYEADGVFNTVASSFEDLGNSTTKCTTESEFQFKGFMKVIAFLMPGSFKKQSLKYLTDFKKFAEES